MSRSRLQLNRFHPEVEFGGFTDIDGTVGFYSRVQQLLEPRAIVVDAGCGRGTQADDPVKFRRELRILRGKCERVIGLDVDVAARDNPFIDQFELVGRDSPWPLEDRTVDVVLADFVIEHVPDPDRFLAEAGRILRPGGTLCIRTINAWSYVGIASRLVPHPLHTRVLGRVQSGRQADDVFPTLYRCNTLGRLRRALDRHGFASAVYGTEAEPAYLSFSRTAYALGLAHRRFAPAAMKVGIFAWGRLRADGAVLRPGESVDGPRLDGRGQ